MEEKYLKYRITTTKAGLKHQSYNLKTLIAESYMTGRIPVISKLHLYGKHNFGKGLSTNLGEYYSLENISLKNSIQRIAYEEELASTPVQIPYNNPIPENEKFVEKVFPAWEGCSWKYVDSSFDIYHEVKLPYLNTLNALANQVISKLGENYACVHVRRGDVLKFFSRYRRLWLDTRPARILQVLDKNSSPGNVYIMSNEKSSFFRFKKSPYKFWLYSDFPTLADIRLEDNYKLFCIENIIMEHAKLRISTFKDANPLYHDSLSEVLF